MQADASSCGEIQRRYADHLYSKHDYDGAMTQYVSTIGYLEPSYVIRKFLDAQRIHNLTSYLEQLHEQVSSLGLFCAVALASSPACCCLCCACCACFEGHMCCACYACFA